MRAYSLGSWNGASAAPHKPRGTTQMTFGKITSVVDRLAVAIVYAAVVLVMPLAAYTFVAQSM